MCKGLGGGYGSSSKTGANNCFYWALSKFN